MDARLARTFALTEKVKLDLFAEAFNLFNHFNVTQVRNVQYALGGTAPNLLTLTRQSTWQLPNNTTTTSRIIQLGAKFNF